MQCKSCNISEMVSDKWYFVNDTTWRHCYCKPLIVLFLMTLSDIFGHLPVVILFKCDFFCEAVVQQLIRSQFFVLFT